MKRFISKILLGLFLTIFSNNFNDAMLVQENEKVKTENVANSQEDKNKKLEVLKKLSLELSKEATEPVQEISTDQIRKEMAKTSSLPDLKSFLKCLTVNGLCPFLAILIHESGHAVANILLGLGLEKVCIPESVCNSNGCQGLQIGKYCLGYPAAGGVTHPGSRCWLGNKCILTTLAGPLAGQMGLYLIILLSHGGLRNLIKDFKELSKQNKSLSTAQFICKFAPGAFLMNMFVYHLFMGFTSFDVSGYGDGDKLWGFLNEHGISKNLGVGAAFILCSSWIYLMYKTGKNFLEFPIRRQFLQSADDVDGSVELKSISKKKIMGKALLGLSLGVGSYLAYNYPQGYEVGDAAAILGMIAVIEVGIFCCKKTFDVAKKFFGGAKNMFWGRNSKVHTS